MKKQLFFLTWLLLGVAVGLSAQDETANPAVFEFTSDLAGRADAGDRTAAFQLGYCYYYGREAPLCPSNKLSIKRGEALRYLRMAADKGHCHALFLVACYYYNGYAGVSQDYGKARKMFQQAAERGCLDAMVNLSIMYTEGQGVKADFQTAQRYMLQAAEQGSATAQYNMYIRLFLGVGGTAIDKPKAISWLEKSAAQNYLPAIRDLAVRVMNGEGTALDPDRAIGLMQKAADLGDAMAWHNLGVYYYNGMGVEQDRDEAARSFYRALKGGYSGANAGLQDCYKAGALDAIVYPSFQEWLVSVKSADNALALQPQKVAAPQPGGDKQQLPTVAVQTRQSPVDKDIPRTGLANDNTFVVVIANEHYRREVAVPYAGNDGETFVDYCTQALGIPGKNIRLVKDATLNDMRAELNWLDKVVAVVGSEARVMFYYAGHGVPDESTRDAYLLPVDGFSNDVGTGVRLSDLYKRLGGLQVAQTVVFLDACFSGSKREDGMLQAARGVRIKARAGAPQGNMVVFSAATGDETAYPYTQMQHGLFSYFLFRKLQESRGRATLGELSDYIGQHVSREALLNNNKPQTPTVSVSESLKGKWTDIRLFNQ